MKCSKLIIQLLTFIILPILSFSQSAPKSSSDNLQNCQNTIFNPDNNNNDTSKICIENRGIADTTECTIYGHIIDKFTLQPVKNAVITLVKEPDEFKGNAITDKNGKFELGVFGFIENKGTLAITSSNYRCLIIEGFQFESTGDVIEVTLRLQPK